MSGKTLSRFRKRCYEYERETGVDLIRECVTGLGQRIARLMGISQRVKRMDSMRNSGEPAASCAASATKLLAHIRKLTPSEPTRLARGGLLSLARS